MQAEFALRNNEIRGEETTDADMDRVDPCPSRPQCLLLPLRNFS
jgi:hypothetical protein